MPILVLLTLFALNSYQSIVGYSEDQHFQILEFANFKRGLIDASELAWEYRYQERQALQPWIVFHILGVLDLLGFSSPVGQIRVIRLVTALFMAFSLYRFILSTLPYFRPSNQVIYIWASCLFWIIPCYYVHFASETFAQALMLLGCSFLFANSKSKYHLYWSGLLFGLAFFARFQSALTVAVIVLLYLSTHWGGWRPVFQLIAGGVLGLLVGVYADYWFYDEWVFTPYRYLEFQLLKGVVDAFGTSPFSYYFSWFFWMSTPFIGLLIYLGLLGNFLVIRRNPLFLPVFVTTMFLSFVGHKEPRFLLQILAFFPFVVGYGLQAIQDRLGNTLPKKFVRVALAFVVLLNAALLVLGTLKNNGWMNVEGTGMAPFMTENYAEEEFELFYIDHYDHPYKIQSFDPEPADGGTHFGDRYLYRKFYLPKGFSDRWVESLGDGSLLEEKGAPLRVVCIRKNAALADPALDQLLKKGYTLRRASIPLWLDRILPTEGVWGKKFSERIVYVLEGEFGRTSR